MATRTWSFTSQPNTGSGNKTITVSISKFTVSGDTSSYLGSVGANPLTITHYHSSTSSTHKWKLRVELLLGDGTTKLVSNTVEHSCNNSVVGWTNTIASITNEQLAVLRSNGIKSVSVVIENVPSSGWLYWRANSDYPFEINLTFEARAARVPNIISTTLNWGTDTMYYYAGIGSLNFGFEAEYDTGMGAKFASAKLELEYEGVPLAGDPDEVVLNDGEFTFFGPINTTGTVTWTCTVTDTLGNSSTATGSFTVAQHVPATISAFTVQRYGFDIQGQPVLKTDGTRAQITINVSGTQAATVQKKNGTTVANNASVYLRIQEEGSSSYYSATLQASLAPNGSYSVTDNRNIDTATRYASVNYTYSLIVEDYITQTTSVVTLSRATALLNIERNGVSIGKRVSKGTAATPIFDVAMDAEFEGSVKIGGYDMNSVAQSQALDLSISSQFGAWTTAGAPKVMRVGPFVYLTGGIITTSQLTHMGYDLGYLSDSSLPSWARPRNTVGFVQSANATDFFIKVVIDTNGWVHLRSQYNTGTIDQNVAFYLDCNWIAADVYPS